MKEMLNFAFEYVSCVVFFGIAFVSVYWHFIMFFGKEKYDPVWSFCLVISVLMSMYIFNTYYSKKTEKEIVHHWRTIKIYIDPKDGTGQMQEIISISGFEKQNNN